MYAITLFLALGAPPQAPKPPQAPPLREEMPSGPALRTDGGYCSPLCTCGCRQGRPCTCGQPRSQPMPEHNHSSPPPVAVPARRLMQYQSGPTFAANCSPRG